MKDIFEKEKIVYKNIEIPEKLDSLIIKSINEGKKKSTKIEFMAKIIAASLITFFIVLNVVPRFSTLAQSLPIIGKLAELLTIDKGFNHAVEEGLVHDIRYENEINGIRLSVSNIVGDYKSMWIEYELAEDYKADVKLMDINDEEEISAFYTYTTEAYGKSGNYIQCNFEEFEKEFLLIFNIYNKDKSEKLAVFKIPIKLEEKFNHSLDNISINNKVIKTEVGDIEIKEIKTSKTRTSMTFILNSDDYKFVKFENPVLIDRNGNEHKISSSYFINDRYGNNNIEFQGEVKIGNITFKCDGIFYDKKYDKKIIVDLKNKLVQDNEYNTTFEGYENNILKLKTENVEGIEFKEEENKYKFNSQSVHQQEIGENLYKIYEVITSFDILDESDGIIEIDIDSISKDKINGFEFKLNN
ncbi:hypothetical protein A500_10725 [Clostridium sartagoforme AAU1]|uniref:DUF4179 domain-containing protein n=1 Tax=Clostridium sartagoforme AAU1 TaxID=1202534 RepID=R9CDA6_9CLOT|nr:DUF4179 domain-containing protein [Clostridium sartagoforme]EOR25206.1 hypothetical protein A500_10725 [Clostridium sartagoforme AAU1]